MASAQAKKVRRPSPGDLRLLERMRDFSGRKSTLEDVLRDPLVQEVMEAEQEEAYGALCTPRSILVRTAQPAASARIGLPVGYHKLVYSPPHQQGSTFIYVPGTVLEQLRAIDESLEGQDSLFVPTAKGSDLPVLSNEGFHTLMRHAQTRNLPTYYRTNTLIVDSYNPPLPMREVPHTTILAQNVGFDGVLAGEPTLDIDRYIRADFPVPPVLRPEADATRLYPSQRVFGFKPTR